MPKCDYCHKTYENPRGTTLVQNDGTIRHLCGSKCMKNMKMKRRKVRWVSKRKESAKDIREEIMAEAEQEHHDVGVSEEGKK